MFGSFNMKQVFSEPVLISNTFPNTLQLILYTQHAEFKAGKLTVRLESFFSWTPCIIAC
jgi:hypothetical protein